MTVLIKNGLKMGWLWQRISGQPAECAPILFLQMKLQSCKGLHTQEEKNLTAAKFSMNVQSWLQNHRFFEKKSAFFKKSKKKFWWLRSTNRYLQNWLKQIFRVVMYLVSRTKTRFYHILGSENGLSPPNYPHGAHWPKFFVPWIRVGMDLQNQTLLA